MYCTLWSVFGPRVNLNLVYRMYLQTINTHNKCIKNKENLGQFPQLFLFVRYTWLERFGIPKICLNVSNCPLHMYTILWSLYNVQNIAKKYNFSLLYDFVLNYSYRTEKNFLPETKPKVQPWIFGNPTISIVNIFRKWFFYIATHALWNHKDKH